MKKIELEINFKIKDLAGLIVELRRMADGQETVQEIKMTYFESPTDKSFYVRIEEIEIRGKKNLFLTYKCNFAREGDLKKCHEDTVEISRRDFYLNFLQTIGLELINEKTKTRHLFHVDNLTVTVDEWHWGDMGDHLEIEGSDDIEIRRLAQKLKKYGKPDQ